MTIAGIGYLAALGVGNGDGPPETFDDLAEVTNISPPVTETEFIKATHMKSPNRFHEFVKGFADAGSASCTLNWVPGGTADLELQALKAKTAETNFRITFPDGASGAVTWIFPGFLETYSIDVPNEALMVANCTFKVTGDFVAGTLA